MGLEAIGRVVRDGATVRRPMGRWSPAVHGLLGHLEAVGFPAPRLVGIEGDIEVLSWIEGVSGVEGWAMVVPVEGLREWARFLSTYHAAVAEYRPEPESEWSSGVVGCGPDEIVCHGDFGPWNGVWRDDQIVGLLDWDHARPASPLFDVAYALEYVAPFRDDQECVRHLRYPEPPDRAVRIETFCSAYGVSVPDDLVALVAEQQQAVMHTVAKLAREQVEPQSTWVRDGYLDVLAQRIRWTETLRL